MANLMQLFVSDSELPSAEGDTLTVQIILPSAEAVEALTSGLLFPENVANRTVKAPRKTWQNAAPGGISRPFSGYAALRGTSWHKGDH